MNVKWLIESSEIPEDIEPMTTALKEQNIEFKEISADFLLRKNFYDFFKKEDCVVFFGSLRTAKHIRRNTEWVPGAYYNVEAYNCDHYYPSYGDFLLNRDYIMLPFGELSRQKEFLYDVLGEDRAIFLRPNRGDKIFTGQLILKEKYDNDIAYFGHGSIEPHELVVAARPINLVEEWRCVCVNGKIITSSSYKKNNLVGSSAGCSQKALEAAQRAAKLYNPDVAWVIDVGETKSGRFCIVEVGCFSCAGMYKCDRSIIVKEVSKAALAEWESYQE